MHKLCVLLGFLSVVSGVLAQTERNPVDSSSTPTEISYCDVSREPATYNHKLIRLTAFIAHGFENFQLSDPACQTQGFSVWVMYGGKVQSDTMYCCPGEGGGGTRSESLEVEGVRTNLIDDAKFSEFTSLLKQEPDTTVHLTAVGTFFSGEKRTQNGQTVWGGAGHLGCCSLFVIQQVESFDPHIRKDLDYSAEAGWYEKEGCKFGSLRDQMHVSVSSPDEGTIRAIEDQKRADHGEAVWVLTDPDRVAEDSLKSVYPGESPVLRIVRKTSPRRVYRWKRGKSHVVVVVTRPYWLSSYSTSRSVAWVTTMIKEAACE